MILCSGECQTCLVISYSSPLLLVPAPMESFSLENKADCLVSGLRDYMRSYSIATLRVATFLHFPFTFLPSFVSIRLRPSLSVSHARVYSISASAFQ